MKKLFLENAALKKQLRIVQSVERCDNEGAATAKLESNGSAQMSLPQIADESVSSEFVNNYFEMDKKISSLGKEIDKLKIEKQSLCRELQKSYECCVNVTCENISLRLKLVDLRCPTTNNFANDVADGSNTAEWSANISKVCIELLKHV